MASRREWVNVKAFESVGIWMLSVGQGWKSDSQGKNPALCGRYKFGQNRSIFVNNEKQRFYRKSLFCQ